jgi:hypothetical protein
LVFFAALGAAKPNDAVDSAARFVPLLLPLLKADVNWFSVHTSMPGNAFF